MSNNEAVNILLVDDQPAKLLSYEVILQELGENLIRAGSAREAFEHLLRNQVAVILIDVMMPDMDGFELATMIRGHPRFEQAAIIFVSAVHMTDLDRLRGYEVGAVDYVSVPVVADLLRAKVRVFADLYRKTRQLARVNVELERRVTERTAALEASSARLRESDQRRSLALAAGHMGAWDWELLTNAQSWDEGQHRIFGTDPQHFLPSAAAMLAIVHPEDRNALQTVTSTAASNGTEYAAEFRIVRPDGEVRWCVVGAAPTLGAGGHAVRISGVTHDVTEQRRSRDILTEANAELERRVEDRTHEREAALARIHEMQKMESLGQLTGGVAHDFNNLLMVILVNLELLRKRLPDDPMATRLLNGAIQGAERGATLTERMLAFARRQELKPETVDVPSLVNGMTDLLRRSLGPAIQIGTDFINDLPAIRVDPNQLELTLLNLAVNARDAMPLGGQLVIAARRMADSTGGPVGLVPGPYLRLAVSDGGLGMDAETLKRATEPFFTTKGVGKGTGLGLSMVHGFAAQSGGGMQIISNPGVGTTIELWLPVATNAAGQEHVAADSREPNVATVGPAPPMCIMVVDDDPLVAAGTADMLRDMGHTVIEVCSGARALETLRSGAQIALVITDHAMPGMTGLQLAKQIQENWPSMPVILASGYADLPDDTVLNLPRLAKPYRQEQLASLINQLLGSSPITNVVAIGTARRP